MRVPRHAATILWLVAGVALFAVAASRRTPIRETRRGLGLESNDALVEDLPPELAFTQAALGSFRGIATNWLWARTLRLNDQGKYHEAMQLADWITQLQPRFASVWGYQAWNMSFNISATTETPSERWSWVRAGIELLRDRGIPLNPEDVDLYRELGWIFTTKVAAFSDTAHWHYKHELAREWHALLGAVPDGDTHAVIEQFRPIATAWEERVRPALARQADPIEALAVSRPDVRLELERLRAHGLTVDHGLLEKLSLAIAVRDSADARVLGVFETEELAPTNEFLRAWLSESETADARALLLATLRASILHDEYHMDPSWMLSLMEGDMIFDGLDEDTVGIPRPEHGLPLDWRHPLSHGLYWTSLGVRRGLDDERRDDNAVYRADTQMQDALFSLLETGRLIFDPISGYYRSMSDTRYADAYHYTAIGSAVRLARLERGAGVSDEVIWEDHQEFLAWAVQALWFDGKPQHAERYYAILRQRFGGEDAPPGEAEHLRQPLRQYVLTEFLRQASIDRIDRASAAIDGLIQQAIRDGLAAGRPDVARLAIEQARAVWMLYADRKESPGDGSDESEPRGIVQLPPFGRMVADVFTAFLLEPVRSRHDLPLRSRAWHNAPHELRRAVWPRVWEPLYSACRARKLKPDLAFPAIDSGPSKGAD